MRTPVGKIAAPMFPGGIEWLNADDVRMERLLGRPVLIEFFDVCRVSSLHTLPYVQAWAAKYRGLRVGAGATVRRGWRLWAVDATTWSRSGHREPRPGFRS